MATNLPDNLRREIEANPGQAAPLVDEQSGKTYYVCDSDFLLGPGQHSEESRQRLVSLIEAGFASPEISKEDAEARIKAKLDQV